MGETNEMKLLEVEEKHVKVNITSFLIKHPFHI